MGNHGKPWEAIQGIIVPGSLRWCRKWSIYSFGVSQNSGTPLGAWFPIATGNVSFFPGEVFASELEWVSLWLPDSEPKEAMGKLWPLMVLKTARFWSLVTSDGNGSPCYGAEVSDLFERSRPLLNRMSGKPQGAKYRCGSPPIGRQTHLFGSSQRLINNPSRALALLGLFLGFLWRAEKLSASGSISDLIS